MVALSDENADIVEQYSYDVFGEPNTTSSVGNPYMFTGRNYDDETGLYYYRARYYSSEIGRFLQTDPIGYIGGNNLYTYVWNNPINLIDPRGMAGYIVVWGGGGPIYIPDDTPPGSPSGCESLLYGIVGLFYRNIRGLPGGVTNDLFAHCYISCRLSQECSHVESWLLGWIKEIRDLALGGGITASAEDMAANIIGRNCSDDGDCPGSQQCLSCCQRTYGSPGGMSLP